MFFPELPSYRPGPVYADLLEWHRQTRLGLCQPVFQFTPVEFALVVARAELAGVLACAWQSAGPAGREAIEGWAARLARWLRRGGGSPPDASEYYCREFVELARRHGPHSARTVLEYAAARAAWETGPDRPAVQEIEAYADRLRTTTEEILRMLDFPRPGQGLRFPMPATP
jgi:hypothetical protein